MAIPATQLRPGMVIKHNNDLHSVFSVEHRTPGNLRAFIQAKLRNLRPAPCSNTVSAPAILSRRSRLTKSRWSSSTPMATTITS